MPDVIVLDTLNFDPEIKKFKSTDLIAAESLRLSIPFYANDTQHNKDKVQKLRFDELVEARSNVSGVCLRVCLRIYINAFLLLVIFLDLQH